MTDYSPTEITKLLIVLHARLMKEKYFDSAISIGVIAYNIAQKTEDRKFEDLAKSWVAMGSEGLTERSSGLKSPPAGASEPSCSFCGRREPEVRLAAGATAFICNSCVATLSEALSDKS